MDLTQNVKVVISGDAQPLQTATKQAEATMAKSQRNMSNAAARSGRDTGDQFGRAFNRAQDRWLNVAENGFRKWGGSVGGVIADVLSAFDKLEKAQIATERLGKFSGGTSHMGGSAAGRIATEAGGTALGNTVGTGVGAGAGVRLGRKGGAFDRLKNKPVFNWTDEDRAVYSQGLAGESPARKGLFRRIFGADLTKVTGGAVGGVGIAIGGGLAAIAAVTKAFSMLADKYKEIKDRQNEFANNQTAIDSINRIGDATERTRAILAKYGEDGLRVFRELGEAQAKLAKQVEKDKSWETAALQGSIAWEGLKEQIGSVWDAVKRGVGKTVATLGSPLGVSEDTASDIIKQEENLRKMTKAVDEQAKRNLKIADEKKKVEEEIAKIQKETMDAADDAIERQNKERIRGMEEALAAVVKMYEQEAESLKNTFKSVVDAIRDKNPGKYDNMTDMQTAIAESESMRLSLMSPSEIALENANKGISGNASAQRVRNTLNTARTLGSTGSFRQQIISARQMTATQSTRDAQAALQRLIQDYNRYGAMPVIPHNGE